jgi:mono/diheme cytochrome c family protein
MKPTWCWLFLGLAICVALTGCDVERRKTDAELGLNEQQAAGRKVYDAYCDRCHEPYSRKAKQGPSLRHMFKNPYLEMSGLPANDDRVREIILYGRSKMPAYQDKMTQQQLNDLLAYLHTL